jgi:putative ABC transport system substrate-binding protein
MRRRDLIVCGAGWMLVPTLGAAQSVGMLRVGLLVPGPYDPKAALMVAFFSRMRELGYRESQNVAFEGRGGPQQRLPALAAELLALDPHVVVAWGGPAVAAAKARTSTTPVVIAISSDPVKLGFVTSLARPGGNVTGVSWQYRELFGKQVEVLREMVPAASRIGVLWDSTEPAAAEIREALQYIARERSLRFELAEAPDLAELGAAFAAFNDARVDGVVVVTTGRHMNNAKVIAGAALDARLPAVFAHRGAVRAGGLISYGPDFFEMARTAADYVDRIARGARPADLPIALPARFHLLVNLKTANALGLAVPQPVLLRADQVIE